MLVYLLRLYPRVWRERYGEEFLATVGSKALSLQQMIDILSGAIDAWLSADVRRATRAYKVAPSGGGPPMSKSIAICTGTDTRYTKRDALIGAGVMIAATLVFSILGIAARRSGWPVSADILLSLSFPGSLALSMPFWLTKGQPWKAQAVIVGLAFTILIAIGSLAAIIKL